MIKNIKFFLFIFTIILVPFKMVALDGAISKANTISTKNISNSASLELKINVGSTQNVNIKNPNMIHNDSNLKSTTLNIQNNTLSNLSPKIKQITSTPQIQIQSQNTIQQEFILPEKIIINNIDNTFYEKIPEKFKPFFEIYYPKKINTTTLKDKILIKGVCRINTPVLINGKEIEIREDGRFFYNFDLKMTGKYPIIITFCTPEFKPINIKKKIIKLQAPEFDFKKYKKQRKDIIYFFNTKYAFPLQNRKLTDYLTRADLAYFIGKIKNIAQNKVKHSVFIDVPANHWASLYIQNVALNNIMSEYPDGKFYPEKKVKKIEYIITLVRAFGYKPESEDTLLPYKDINPQHWTFRYIQTGYAYHLIPATTYLRPNTDLSILEFISMIKNLDAVHKEMLNFSNFEKGFDLQDTQKEKLISEIKTIFGNKKAKMIKNQTIELFSPTDKELFLQKEITFRGKTFPPTNIYINNKIIKPSLNGVFVATFKADKPVNKFNIKIFNKTKTITTYYLPSYSDLKGHWLEITASKCKSLKLTEQSDLFEPKKKISRGELSEYLVSFFDLTPSNNIKMNFKDVSEKNLYYASIKTVYDNQILKGIGNKFLPNKKITRLEAIIAIVRASKLKLNPTDTLVRLPFRDISTKHWAYKTLQLAYKYKLISSKSRLKPKELISKAELIAMITKTEIVQKKLLTVFAHD